MKILEEIKRGEKFADENKENVYFYFDLDNNTFWYENEDGRISEILSCSYDFYFAKNEYEEKRNGVIFFKIKPGKRKSFLLLYLRDNINNFYTIFSDPFLDVQVLKGEIQFESI